MHKEVGSTYEDHPQKSLWSYLMFAFFLTWGNWSLRPLKEKEKAIDPKRPFKEKEKAIVPWGRLKEKENAIVPKRPLKEKENEIDPWGRLKEKENAIDP